MNINDPTTKTLDIEPGEMLSDWQLYVKKMNERLEHKRQKVVNIETIDNLKPVIKYEMSFCAPHKRAIRRST